MENPYRTRRKPPSARRREVSRATKSNAPEQIDFAIFLRMDDESPVQIWVDWERPESETALEEYQIQFRTKGSRTQGLGRWTNVDVQPLDRRTKNFYCPSKAIADPRNKVEMQIRAKNSAGWGPWSKPFQET